MCSSRLNAYDNSEGLTHYSLADTCLQQLASGQKVTCNRYHDTTDKMSIELLD